MYKMSFIRFAGHAHKGLQTKGKSISNEHRISPLPLTPYAFKGGYINVMDEQERVLLAFRLNYERLLDLKRKYDPDDVFRSTIEHLAI